MGQIKEVPSTRQVTKKDVFIIDTKKLDSFANVDGSVQAEVEDQINSIRETLKELINRGRAS